MNKEQGTPSETAIGRIRAIDVARGAALLAMAIYHFTWDLEFFGALPAMTTSVGGWKFFARAIASSFLFLVGFSLVLAHYRAIRWHSFWKRFAMVAAAALAISLITDLVIPGGFIFFGILHQIALASLLGLALLRLPVPVLALLGGLVIAGPYFLSADLFNMPLLWWVGLATQAPRSNDYVPLFPWFGIVILGMAAARFALQANLLRPMAAWQMPGATKPLELIGRHSLAFYLLHQPVLLAGLWLYTQVFPFPVPDPAIAFTNSCMQQCEPTRGKEFCAIYCDCVLENLEAKGGVARFDDAANNIELRSQVEEIVLQCTNESDFKFFGGEKPNE